MSADTGHRATGASLAVIILVSVGFAAIILLHVTRTDLDPVREVMSAYANGSFGIAMTLAFYALGIAAIVLALRLPRATRGIRTGRWVAILLAVAGVGLIVAGVFEVERPQIPDTIEEIVHSDAALGAFVVLIGAMVLFTVVCHRHPSWRGFFAFAVAFAVTATIAAAFSPLADKTPWTGIAQRVLGLTVFGWLLVVALHIRFHPAHRRPLLQPEES